MSQQPIRRSPNGGVVDPTGGQPPGPTASGSQAPQTPQDVARKQAEMLFRAMERANQSVQEAYGTTAMPLYQEAMTEATNLQQKILSDHAWLTTDAGREEWNAINRKCGEIENECLRKRAQQLDAPEPPRKSRQRGARRANSTAGSSRTPPQPLSKESRVSTAPVQGALQTAPQYVGHGGGPVQPALTRTPPQLMNPGQHQQLSASPLPGQPQHRFTAINQNIHVPGIGARQQMSDAHAGQIQLLQLQVQHQRDQQQRDQQQRDQQQRDQQQRDQQQRAQQIMARQIMAQQLQTQQLQTQQARHPNASRQHPQTATQPGQVPTPNQVPTEYLKTIREITPPTDWELSDNEGGNLGQVNWVSREYHKLNQDVGLDPNSPDAIALRKKLADQWHLKFGEAVVGLRKRYSDSRGMIEGANKDSVTHDNRVLGKEHQRRKKNKLTISQLTAENQQSKQRSDDVLLAAQKGSNELRKERDTIKEDRNKLKGVKEKTKTGIAALLSEAKKKRRKGEKEEEEKQKAKVEAKLMEELAKFQPKIDSMETRMTGAVEAAEKANANANAANTTNSEVEKMRSEFKEMQTEMAQLRAEVYRQQSAATKEENKRLKKRLASLERGSESVVERAKSATPEGTPEPPSSKEGRRNGRRSDSISQHGSSEPLSDGDDPARPAPHHGGRANVARDKETPEPQSGRERPGSALPEIQVRVGSIYQTTSGQEGGGDGGGSGGEQPRKSPSPSSSSSGMSEIDDEWREKTKAEKKKKKKKKEVAAGKQVAGAVAAEPSNNKKRKSSKRSDPNATYKPGDTSNQSGDSGVEGGGNSRRGSGRKTPPPKKKKVT